MEYLINLTTLIFSSVISIQNDSLELVKDIEQGIGSLEELIRYIWYFNIFSVKGQAVQVNQIVIALILLVIGVFVSHWMTHRLKRYLRKHSQLDDSSILFLQRITFYILIVIIVLSTLQMIEIPITMFAYFGGAIIIGVGFGAQNIFNNFISGIILMIERPVRIGDIIEVDTDIGKVEEVGARCTRIRRFDGVEMLVPNSKLLENNVINRTLSDKKIRTTVTVGVAYGSPTKQTSDVIQTVVDGHKDILPDPKPEVFFSEFGDSALIFEVYFWVEAASMMDIRRIRSDIRFKIDDKFREAAIVIAFPQRDMHIDSLRPIDIHIVDQKKT
ncbi:mechanosensitive ion channel [bacterium]|nr:mechanosensitive ion channel [bacterium]